MKTAAAVCDLQRRLPSRLRLPNILRAADGCGRWVRSLHKKWMNVISGLGWISLFTTSSCGCCILAAVWDFCMNVSRSNCDRSRRCFVVSSYYLKSDFWSSFLLTCFADHIFAVCCICRLIQLRLGHSRLWRLRGPVYAPGLRVGLLLCVLHRLGRYPFFHWSTNNCEWARLVV